MKHPSFQLQYDPANIRKLADEYMAISAADDRKMEDAGKRIAQGDLSRSNLEIIYRWKSQRRVRLLDNNRDTEIKHALKNAINAVDVKTRFAH
jgi:hypothetical protein